MFGPPIKNSYFSDFPGILALFSAEIFRSGNDISIPIIYHLLELDKCFPTIHEQILLLALFESFSLNRWKIACLWRHSDFIDDENDLFLLISKLHVDYCILGKSYWNICIFKVFKGVGQFCPPPWFK